VEPEKSVRIMESGAFSNARPFYPDEELMGDWMQLISAAGKWLKQVEKDWVKANKQAQEEYPLKYRYGTVPHCLVRESIPGAFRLDKALGKTRPIQAEGRAVYPVGGAAGAPVEGCLIDGLLAYYSRKGLNPERFREQ